MTNKTIIDGVVDPGRVDPEIELDDYDKIKPNSSDKKPIKYIIDRVVNLDDDGKVTRFIKVKANSSDKKPIDGICEGSTWYDKDTATLYIFNAERKNWDAIGGGSSGSEDFFVVRFSTKTVDVTKDGRSTVLTAATLDKTYSEICDAVEAGKFVVINDQNHSSNASIFGIATNILFFSSAAYSEQDHTYHVIFYAMDNNDKQYDFMSYADDDYMALVSSPTSPK